jgi:rhodanese-related sulfurtransferase
MTRKRFISLLICVVIGWAASAGAAGAPKISKEELRVLLDRPEVVVIDVRTSVSWLDSKFKIKGAVREDPTRVNTWIDKYPKDKTLVFYCS